MVPWPPSSPTGRQCVPTPCCGPCSRSFEATDLSDHWLSEGYQASKEVEFDSAHRVVIINPDEALSHLSAFDFAGIRLARRRKRKEKMAGSAHVQAAPTLMSIFTRYRPGLDELVHHSVLLVNELSTSS